MERYPSSNWPTAAEFRASCEKDRIRNSKSIQELIRPARKEKPVSVEVASNGDDIEEYSNDRPGDWTPIELSEEGKAIAKAQANAEENKSILFTVVVIALITLVYGLIFGRF